MSTAPKSPGTCAAMGCQAPIKPGHLMCAAHWRMVPLQQQRAVNRAWAARIRCAAQRDRQQYDEAAAEHIRAKAAAVRAVAIIEGLVDGPFQPDSEEPTR